MRKCEVGWLKWQSFRENVSQLQQQGLSQITCTILFRWQLPNLRQSTWAHRPSICQQTSISKQGIACNVSCCAYIPLFYEVLLRNMMYTALINGLSLDIGIYSIIMFPPCQPEMHSLIARFTGPTWGPYGADRTQVGPMLAPWTLLSGIGSTCCYLNPKSRLWHWLTKNFLFLR